MDRSCLIAALSSAVPEVLAADLIDNLLTLRRDVATGTLGGPAPGKFVETLVQILQFLESGEYDASPSVDAFLRGLESRPSSLDDGLRICAARIGRAMYTLRSKRNISHKGQVDPNAYDLRFLHQAAQWVAAELIRSVSGLPMEQTGKLVEVVQTPVGGLVQDFGDRKLVLRDMPTREEILVLLHSQYPNVAPTEHIVSSLDRRSERTVRNALRALWASKHVEGSPKAGYTLTARGFDAAAEIVTRHLEG